MGPRVPLREDPEGLVVTYNLDAKLVRVRSAPHPCPLA